MDQAAASKDGKQATAMPAADPKPAVEQQPPEKVLENQLKANPHDLDAKVDVGSDESMDASDPSAAAQPGQNDEPVPSSGFPEDEPDSDKVGIPRP